MNLHIDIDGYPVYEIDGTYFPMQYIRDGWELAELESSLRDSTRAYFRFTKEDTLLFEEFFGDNQ